MTESAGERGPAAKSPHGSRRAERLSACYTGIIYDVMRDAGWPDCVLPADIRPLAPDQRIAAPVFTISGRTGQALTEHETVLRWTEFLSQAPAGHAVVCQPNDRSLAHMGELSAETLKHRGIAGYLVDGGCRDTAFIERIQFPVFCRYRTPRDIVCAWTPERFGEPVRIGEVLISTGDFLLADADGAVIVPGSMIDPVLDRAETLMNAENLVRKAILRGESPKDAYLAYGKF